MDRVQKALENHKKGYNCAQAVLCAFCDKTSFSEDELFKISEAFGFGMGTQGVCGAVSAMTFLAGISKSAGIASLPHSNKRQSYELSRDMITAFENKNKSVICQKIKGENLRSCDGCIEDAVEIIEKTLK